LQGIHPAVQTAVPSSSTPGYRQQHQGGHSTTSSVGDSIPLLWSIPGHLPGTMAIPRHNCLLHSPQLLTPTIANCRIRFRLSSMLPVHSPLLGQSLLLELPPLSDMLKFGGLLPVHQVFSQSIPLKEAIWYPSTVHTVATGSWQAESQLTQAQHPPMLSGFQAPTEGVAIATPLSPHWERWPCLLS
jgi:hypothetical protein